MFIYISQVQCTFNLPQSSTNNRHSARWEGWRHVTMEAKLLDHKNRELKQRRPPRQRKQLKRSEFMLAKQQLCTCILPFCTVLSLRCTTATWNFLISRACFINPTQKFYFFFILNLNTFVSHSTPENCANVWQIKWNWIRSIKFETLRIHFLSEFPFVVIKKFCYHGNVK